MDREEIKRVIFNILENHYECNDVQETDHITNDLGLGSLDRIEFIMEMEKYLHSLCSEDFIFEENKINNIRRIKDYIDITYKEIDKLFNQ